MGACLLGGCGSRVVDTGAVFREGMLANRARSSSPALADEITGHGRGMQQSKKLFSEFGQRYQMFEITGGGGGMQQSSFGVCTTSAALLSTTSPHKGG